MHSKVDPHGSFWPSQSPASWRPSMAFCKAPGRLESLKPFGPWLHCEGGSRAQKTNALHSLYLVIIDFLCSSLISPSTTPADCSLL